MNLFFRAILSTYNYIFRFYYVIFGYLLTLIFSIFAISYNNISIFEMDITFSYLDFDKSLLIAILIIFFSTAIISFFNTILIFLVRKDMQKYYKSHLKEILEKRFLEIFIVNFTINILLFFLFIIFNKIYIFPIIAITTYIFTFYVNQSILIDEYGIKKSFKNSYYFVKNNIKYTAFISIYFTINYFLIILLSFYIPNGYIIGYILIHVIMLPSIEILKTQIYMTKFKILEKYF